MACTGRGAPVYPASISRVPSPYANPRSWTPPARLIQGMEIVITGTTTRSRQALARQLSELGFDVMNSVSSQTRLLVCNEPAHVSVKHEKALALGIPVVTEVELVALLPLALLVGLAILTLLAADLTDLDVRMLDTPTLAMNLGTGMAKSPNAGAVWLFRA